MENQTPRKPVVIVKNPPNRTKEQQAGFLFIAISGVCAIILGSFYVMNHVNSPFDNNYEGPRFLTTAERDAQLIEEQKTRDTDGDGLTDYDELYLYRTSPYLYDTDGDGIPDPVEIQAGTDPNCIGDSCDSLNDTQAAPSQIDFSDIGQTAQTAQSVLASPIVTGVVDAPVNDTEPGIDTLTVAQIRELLVVYGSTQEQVDALSDEQVQAVYQSALREIQTTPNP